MRVRREAKQTKSPKPRNTIDTYLKIALGLYKRDPKYVCQAEAYTYPKIVVLYYF